MDAYSLFCPPGWLPWYMWPVWPLIFWRIRRLKAWFDAQAGKGSQMLWGVDRWGRVRVICLSDDLSGRTGAAQPVPVAPSRRLLAALGGDALLPVSLSCPRCGPGPRAARPAPGIQGAGRHRVGGYPSGPVPDP